MTDKTLQYTINNPLELNLSYMPFLVGGGLFVPTAEVFALGDKVTVDLLLASSNQNLTFEGKVVWVTPKGALHHVLPGVGVQFIGDKALDVRKFVETNLDTKMEVGGYTYGLTDGAGSTKKS